LDYLTDIFTIEEYSFDLTSGDIEGIVGIAVNGVPIFSGVSEFGVDAFFPTSYNGRKTPLPIDFD